MDDQKHNEPEALSQFIQLGSEIAGGAAVGGLTGGLGGAIGGAATPLAIRALGRLAVEFRQRVLGHREEVRAGAVIVYTAMKIEENIVSGQQVRQDDFFQEQLGDRSAAEEIAEGVLLIAQREHQERKLKIYGNLLANIVFRTDIDRGMANALVSQVERMSYRQICILSLIVRKSEFDLRDRTYGLMYKDLKLSSILMDAYELAHRGILGIDPVDAPGTVFPTHPMPETGKLLFDLMELRDIDKSELEQIAALLNS